MCREAVQVEDRRPARLGRGHRGRAFPSLGPCAGSPASWEWRGCNLSPPGLRPLPLPFSSGSPAGRLWLWEHPHLHPHGVQEGECKCSWREGSPGDQGHRPHPLFMTLITFDSVFPVHLIPLLKYYVLPKLNPVPGCNVIEEENCVSSLWRNFEALRNMEWKILAKTG